VIAVSRVRPAATTGGVIVLDASVVVEMLLASEAGKQAMTRLVQLDADLHAPELMDVEVLHVLRRTTAGGGMSAARAEEAIAVLEMLPVRRHGHGALRRRVWQHRANLSAYDATYVALAEGLGGRLMTRDGRLARAAGAAIEVQVI
jgi:predicted nucleic acid-binding protein